LIDPISFQKVHSTATCKNIWQSSALAIATNETQIGNKYKRQRKSKNQISSVRNKKINKWRVFSRGIGI
jgi:uncharacterized protein YajQ (UPF0234 family)